MVLSSNKNEAIALFYKKLLHEYKIEGKYFIRLKENSCSLIKKVMVPLPMQIWAL
jgi:hypothetical protein